MFIFTGQMPQSRDEFILPPNLFLGRLNCLVWASLYALKTWIGRDWNDIGQSDNDQETKNPWILLSLHICASVNGFSRLKLLQFDGDITWRMGFPFCALLRKKYNRSANRKSLTLFWSFIFLSISSAEKCPWDQQRLFLLFIFRQTEDSMMIYLLYLLYFAIAVTVALSLLLYTYQCELLYAAGFPTGSRTVVSGLERHGGTAYWHIQGGKTIAVWVARQGGYIGDQGRLQDSILCHDSTWRRSGDTITHCGLLSCKSISCWFGI